MPASGGLNDYVDDYFDKAQKEVIALVVKQPGLKVNEIADILGMNLRMAQVVVGQLMSHNFIRAEGKTRGVKYFPA
ncbi:hypothetical protein ACCAA_1560007 [Candidatus Accumulibacter aalborgensis]|uniref:Uncharacterized protein n=1 Tax=Candidatus Accumulibacter aalborgensis TaxID=1860102 RepID=A0A1A8XH79_9PROT|nr:hypothetical protein [Candidatus Accumulibacter aalborgensis]SBT04539.1 hypothetical protein ACCAA_1560007 [Candidatus Accumulibacter aalborgensis]